MFVFAFCSTNGSGLVDLVSSVATRFISAAAASSACMLPPPLGMSMMEVWRCTGEKGSAASLSCSGPGKPDWLRSNRPPSGSPFVHRPFPAADSASPSAVPSTSPSECMAPLLSLGWGSGNAGSRRRCSVWIRQDLTRPDLWYLVGLCPSPLVVLPSFLCAVPRTH